MSKREKKKKIIAGIVGSAALIGGATGGILYVAETEEKKEEEKKIKGQTIQKPLLPNPPKPNLRSNPARYNNYTVLDQEATIYLAENGEEVTTFQIDLTDENISEIIKIGFYKNGEGEIQAIKMPKTIVTVPNQLPKRITSTKDMFAGATVFNQNIGQWDTSNVKDMTNMFAGATLFHQNLSSWNVTKVIKHEGFATNSRISNSINKLPNFQS